MTPRRRASTNGPWWNPAPHRARRAPANGARRTRHEKGAVKPVTPAGDGPAGGRRRSAAPLLTAAALAGAALLPATAGAQTGGYLAFSGGTQATTTTFAENVGFTVYREDGDFDAGYGVGAGPVFDGGGGVRLASGIGFGVGVSRFDKRDPVSIDARIPHPFFFDRHRPVNGSLSGLTRRETAAHVEVRWFAPTGGAVELAVFGGPTFFDVRQDLVTAVGHDHAYPYDEAAFAAASTSTSSVSSSAFGFHAGADVGFFFSGAVGVGAVLRYSRGSVELTGAGGGTVPVDAGGLHAGGGLRLRF